MLEQSNKRHKFAKPRRLMSEASAKLLNRFVLWWIIAVVLVGSIVDALGVSISTCEFCQEVVSLLPGIKRMAAITTYPEKAESVLFLLAILHPFTLGFLIYKVRDVKGENLAHSIVCIFVFGALSYLLASLCFNGTIFGSEISETHNPSTRYAWIFQRSLLGMLIGAGSIHAGLIGSNLILIEVLFRFFVPSDEVKKQ